MNKTRQNVVYLTVILDGENVIFDETSTKPSCE